MSKSLIFVILLAGSPAAALAQDASSGPIDAHPKAGAASGGAVGGPLGADIDSPVRVLPGGDPGVTGTNEALFRHYVVVDQQIPSYEWLNHPKVKVGDVLPMSGVHYYDVPPDYGNTHYRFTVVDRQPVLVDPLTRRIVQVIH
jgi:hypothetical protein